MALPMKAMKAMKASKAMKSKAMAAMRSGSSGAMTATGAYKSVGESTGLKVKQVKECVEAYMAVAASQLKAAGSFKLAGSINMKLKKKPARVIVLAVKPVTLPPKCPPKHPLLFPESDNLPGCGIERTTPPPPASLE